MKIFIFDDDLAKKQKYAELFLAFGKEHNVDFEIIICDNETAVEHHKLGIEKVITHTSGGELRNFKLNSILYYETQNGKIIVYYDENKSFEFPQRNITILENDLGTYGFFRIHRSFVVALSAIVSLKYDKVVLRNGTKLPVSRAKYAALKQQFNAHKVSVLKT
ncbi:MAG: LytTR family transcriptional regulator DNA-binding domain-containing protein [Oscillospiraceae bacterium]|nr:LytTR family transcriptional regulator DNA-binding domain-containing protein [Oscillospiraceae bacterium]